MPKTCIFKLNFLILMGLSLFITSVYAQELNTVAVEEQPEEVNGQPIVEEVVKNEFENLISAQDLSFQLRKNYGIKGSVLLTKTMWQILTSYSNQQQAQNVWQTAINQVTEMDPNSYAAVVNYQFNSGQILSSYTYGMTLEKWNDSRVGLQVSRNNLNDFLSLNDELTIYMQLNAVWDIIIVDIIKQENILWNDVFLNSVTFFVEPEEGDQSVSTSTANIDIEKKSNLFQEVMQWTQSEELELSLADLMVVIEKMELNQKQNSLYLSIVRFNLNKHYQNYLASSLNWFEVVYRLYLYKSEILDSNDKELQEIRDYIEQIDTWFLSKEQSLLAININLPEMVESSIHELKKYYVTDQLNSSISDNLVENLPTAYDLIETNLKNHLMSPLRNEIRAKLEVCLNISEEFLPFPQEAITRNQFIGCMNDIVNNATTLASERSLAGSIIKVDTSEALDRALQSPAWQTINILYAQVAQSSCLKDSHQLVNPLEWMLAAETMVWFADRWPGYMEYYSKKYQATLSVQEQSKYNVDDQIDLIISNGEKLINGFECLEKPEVEILNTYFTQINQSWQNVKAQIKQVADEFIQEKLSVGSDIDLLASTEKQSNYRVESAQIEPCDAQKSCGVHVTLESSRALFGLFPQHLLLADQLKLGTLKLCYDNVGWENRRSAATHLDNDNVANYFGNFSFSIKGFYDEEQVFERKIIDDEEYHYLFAENSEEVLATYCPLSIVGNKISTELERGTFGLVPNRLTFLTASRVSEGKILTGNWSTGSEWKDKISSQDINVVSENKLAELEPVTQKAYQAKAKQLQELIYKTMLFKQQNLTEKQQLLYEAFANLKRTGQLFSHMLYIMRTDDYLSKDQLQGIMFGIDKIPDVNTIISHNKNQLNINQLILTIDEDIKINQNKWNDFETTRSNAYLNNILFRLKSINH